MTVIRFARGGKLIRRCWTERRRETPFVRSFLPRCAVCKNFVNADLIAKGVAPFQRESAAIRAGRLMLQEIDRYAGKREDFGIETTLSGRSYVELFRHVKQDGYRIHIFFLWVSNASLARSRVDARVRQGGHDIPDPVLRRRFDRAIANFFNLYAPLSDTWWLFDNSELAPVDVAFVESGAIQIIQPALYNRLLERYAK